MITLLLLLSFLFCSVESKGLEHITPHAGCSLWVNALGKLRPLKFLLLMFAFYWFVSGTLWHNKNRFWLRENIVNTIRQSYSDINGNQTSVCLIEGPLYQTHSKHISTSALHTCNSQKKIKPLTLLLCKSVSGRCSTLRCECCRHS